MLSLFSVRSISLTVSSLLLAGCTQLYSGLDGYSDRYSDPYAQPDFDELLDFGDHMAKIPSSSRAEACRKLLKHKKSSAGAQIKLHLMIGRLLSDSCGDIPKILDGIASIPPQSLADVRVQRLVSIHTEALKRMNSVSRKLGSLEHKQKTVQSVLESKDAAGSKKNETELLREKLEAIRSMEKHMDESGGDTN